MSQTEPDPIATLNELLLRDEVGSMVRKARRLAEMNAALAGVLPRELALECRVVNFRDGMVVIQASSNAVASKLRMLVPRMKKSLLDDIHIEIRPRPAETQRPERSARLPPPVAGELLRALAPQVDDPKLRDAVMSLARKARHLS